MNARHILTAQLQPYQELAVRFALHRFFTHTTPAPAPATTLTNGTPNASTKPAAPCYVPMRTNHPLRHHLAWKPKTARYWQKTKRFKACGRN